MLRGVLQRLRQFFHGNDDEACCDDVDNRVDVATATMTRCAVAV